MIPPFAVACFDANQGAPVRKFFRELRRRNVYRAGAAYAVAGWLVVQIATQVLPLFDVSPLAMRIIVLVIIAGFPLVLVLSWVYEVTPQGIVKTEEVAPTESITRRTGQRLNTVIIGTLVVAVLFLLAQRYLFPQRSAQSAAPVSDKSIAVLPFDNLSDDKRQRVFRRRHPGRDPDAPGQGRRIARDLAHVDAALREQARQPARDRAPARRRQHPRRQRAEDRRCGAHQRAADPRGDRRSSLGRDLQPQARRHLRRAGRSRRRDRAGIECDAERRRTCGRHRASRRRTRRVRRVPARARARRRGLRLFGAAQADRGVIPKPCAWIRISRWPGPTLRARRAICYFNGVDPELNHDRIDQARDRYGRATAAGSERSANRTRQLPLSRAARLRRRAEILRSGAAAIAEQQPGIAAARSRRAATGSMGSSADPSANKPPRSIRATPDSW